MKLRTARKVLKTVLTPRESDYKVGTVSTALRRAERELYRRKLLSPKRVRLLLLTALYLDDAAMVERVICLVLKTTKDVRACCDIQSLSSATVRRFLMKMI